MEKNNNILIETLIRGLDSTKKLQSLLNREVNLDGSVSVEDLLKGILGSFSSGISMLNSSVSDKFPVSPCVEKMPEVYSGKKQAPVVKERRGCYKRRKTIDSSEKVTGTIEDGYAWRKYGQKEILNSKSPRCYFRCTHKYIHGCKALKQVQKMEDEPNMYHITYIGQHTCPKLTHHEVVLDFQDFKHNYHVSNSPSTITNIHINPSVKQEVDSKDQSTDVSDIVSSANDENLSPPWNEIILEDHNLGSCHVDTSFMKYDHEDSCASTSSHGYLYMDILNNDDDLLNGDIGLLDHMFT